MTGFDVIIKIGSVFRSRALFRNIFFFPKIFDTEERIGEGDNW